MKTAVVAVTDAGAAWGGLIARELPEASFFRPPPGQLPELTSLLFQEYGGIVFVSAVGIALRMIAPLIRSKHQDPAVVAMDDAGRVVVSLLSGHEGGANRLAFEVAAVTGAEPVVTTATEANKTLVLGIGCRRGVSPEEVETAIRAALADHGADPAEVRAAGTTERKRGEAGLREACRRLGIPLLFFPDWKIRRLRGGFRPSRAARRRLGLPGVSEPCALLGGRDARLLGPRRVLGPVTVALAREADPFPPEGITPPAGVTAPADLGPLPGPAAPTGFSPAAAFTLPTDSTLPSDLTSPANITSPPDFSPPSGLTFPPETVGEAAGAAPGTQSGGGQPSPGAPRGRLTVVGIGPGSSDYLAPRARRAIREAELVVGYHRYLSLLGGLLEGKETFSTGMRREEERAEKAVTAARDGKTVALVSSGDAGVYGLAGLALETLTDADLRDIDFQVVPGITAASSCAALLGAPLSNDFAVVSLSDLLTPRETIQDRVRAAAAADLVLVLYNPRSTRRRDLLEWTRDRLLEARGASVPVGLVRAAGRPEERAWVTTLGELPELYGEIDMSATVIVGNSRSRRKGPFIVTPRGYRGRLTSHPHSAYP